MHPQFSDTVFVDGVQFSLLDALVPFLPGSAFTYDAALRNLGDTG